MELIIISGRSGSGKSTALHVLEDLGYYCIDNLPSGLLPALSLEMGASGQDCRPKVAVSIDARNVPKNLKRFPAITKALDQENILYKIIYLDANDETIFKRFSATRRKHPLSNDSTSLKEAISIESISLDPIATQADLKIDTTHLTIHQLREIVKNKVALDTKDMLVLLFESFGFKHGVPTDADVVFDVRCLPNPYWDHSLREHTGKHQFVISFLEQQPIVNEMFDDIVQYLEKWLPRFEANNRSYMTVAIGCTGGQHRSVYLVERLTKHFQRTTNNIQIRHRELRDQP